MFKKALLIFVLLLLLAEGLATLLLPYRKVVKADIALKNDFFKRGWPEYTSAPKKEGHKLVVIIGNSQAYGEEFQTDTNYNYTFWLKKHFDSRQVTIENWSLNGMRTADIELLTTKAMLKGADLILLPLDMTNFDEPQRINLTFPNTDINLLLADPDMWEPIRYSQVAASFERETLLNKWCIYHSSLIRSRTPVFTWCAEETGMSEEEQIFFFGNPITRFRTPDLMQVKEFRDKLGFHSQKKVEVTVDEVSRRKANAERFLQFLQKRANMVYHGKILMVWQPFGRALIGDEKNWDMVQRFRKEMTPVCEKYGVEVQNHTSVVPDSLFMSLSHFNGKGHASYGNYLIPVISSELQ